MDALVLFGNFLVALAPFLNRRLRNPGHYFIASLAWADFALGLFVVPLAISVQIRDGVWPYGEHACQIWQTLDCALCTTSIYSLIAITFDRFIAVSKPLMYKSWMTTKTCALVILIVWIGALAVSVPSIPMTWTRNVHMIRTTCRCTPMANGSPFILYSSIASFYLPMIIILYFYAHIYATVRKIRLNATRGVVNVQRRSPPPATTTTANGMTMTSVNYQDTTYVGETSMVAVSNAECAQSRRFFFSYNRRKSRFATIKSANGKLTGDHNDEEETTMMMKPKKDERTSLLPPEVPEHQRRRVSDGPVLRIHKGKYHARRTSSKKRRRDKCDQLEVTMRAITPVSPISLFTTTPNSSFDYDDQQQQLRNRTWIDFKNRLAIPSIAKKRFSIKSTDRSIAPMDQHDDDRPLSPSPSQMSCALPSPCILDSDISSRKSPSPIFPMPVPQPKSDVVGEHSKLNGRKSGERKLISRISGEHRFVSQDSDQSLMSLKSHRCASASQKSIEHRYIKMINQKSSSQRTLRKRSTGNSLLSQLISDLPSIRPSGVDTMIQEPPGQQSVIGDHNVDDQILGIRSAERSLSYKESIANDQVDPDHADRPPDHSESITQKSMDSLMTTNGSILTNGHRQRSPTTSTDRSDHRLRSRTSIDQGLISQQSMDSLLIYRRSPDRRSIGQKSNDSRFSTQQSLDSKLITPIGGDQPSRLMMTQRSIDPKIAQLSQESKLIGQNSMDSKIFNQKLSESKLALQKYTSQKSLDSRLANQQTAKSTNQQKASESTSQNALDSKSTNQNAPDSKLTNQKSLDTKLAAQKSSDNLSDDDEKDPGDLANNDAWLRLALPSQLVAAWAHRMLALHKYRRKLSLELRALKTVVMVTGCFFVCWTGFCVVYTMQALPTCNRSNWWPSSVQPRLDDSCVPDWLFNLSVWLGYANSAMNPIVYGAMNAQFRRTFRRLVSKVSRVHRV